MPPRGPMQVAQKAKNNKEAFKKLVKYIKPYITVFVIAVILGICSAILTIIGPSKIGEITNLMQAPFESLKETGVLGKMDLEGITKLGITLLIIYGCSFIISLVMNIMLQRLTLKISKVLRKDLIEKVETLTDENKSLTSEKNKLEKQVKDLNKKSEKKSPTPESEEKKSSTPESEEEKTE